MVSIQPWLVLIGTGMVVQPVPWRLAMTGVVAVVSPPIQTPAAGLAARKPQPIGSADVDRGWVANTKPAGPAICCHLLPSQLSSAVGGWSSAAV